MDKLKEKFFQIILEGKYHPDFTPQHLCAELTKEMMQKAFEAGRANGGLQAVWHEDKFSHYIEMVFVYKTFEDFLEQEFKK